MGPDDQRRLQREADIANAVRGPDTTMHDEFVRRVKAELGRRDAAAMDTWSREYAGYQQTVTRGEIRRDDCGNPYRFALRLAQG